MLARFLTILFLVCPTLVQAQQRANCPPGAFQTWGRFLDAGPQTWDVREVIELGQNSQIIALEFGPLAGENAKVWLFARRAGGCLRDVVSLGSYAYFERMGQERRYHLDLYRPNSHATLGFYGEKPTYDEIRKIAVDALK